MRPHLILYSLLRRRMMKNRKDAVPGYRARHIISPIIAVVCALPLLHIPPAGAFVVDSCRRILAEGFYNDYARSNARFRDQAMYAQLCSSKFQHARQAINRAQQSGPDNSFGFSYGLFSQSESGPSPGRHSPDGSLSEDRFNQWKSAYCSKNSLADSSRAAEFLMQKVVPRSVANAWSACMQKREGLTCWATPQNKEIMLNVNWTKTGSLQPQVSHSYLTRGAVSKFEGADIRRILPVGYKLNPETLQIPIARETDRAVVASIQVNHEGVEHSCNVFIPGERDFALTTPFVAR